MIYPYHDALSPSRLCGSRSVFRYLDLFPSCLRDRCGSCWGIFAKILVRDGFHEYGRCESLSCLLADFGPKHPFPLFFFRHRPRGDFLYFSVPSRPHPLVHGTLTLVSLCEVLSDRRACSPSALEKILYLLACSRIPPILPHK